MPLSSLATVMADELADAVCLGGAVLAAVLPARALGVTAAAALPGAAVSSRAAADSAAADMSSPPLLRTVRLFLSLTLAPFV